MILGGYRDSKSDLPQVIHVSIARYLRALPTPRERLTFLVSIHEEGTGVTWQRNVTVSKARERRLLEVTRDLHLWSLNRALTPLSARERVEELGALLYETFLGRAGSERLAAVESTAYLFDVDETILSLPWELIGTSHGMLALKKPFGRLVTTRMAPSAPRNPRKEDNVVRILAVANPSGDLGVSDRTLAELEALDGRRVDGETTIAVSPLPRAAATKAKFTSLIAAQNYDIIHFAGHASLDAREPGASALRFADATLTANEVLKLPWASPPYFVFNNACESGRGVGGRRLVSSRSQANGLAAAFLSAGVQGYAGFFWPVSDVGAGMFAGEFYRSLFMRENVGLAFLDARMRTASELEEVGDLAGHGAVLFGDAASGHRRDLYTAA
jgi:CHAT domain-containing protein